MPEKSRTPAMKAKTRKVMVQLSRVSESFGVVTGGGLMTVLGGCGGALLHPCLKVRLGM